MAYLIAYLWAFMWNLEMTDKIGLLFLRGFCTLQPKIIKKIFLLGRELFSPLDLVFP